MAEEQQVAGLQAAGDVGLVDVVVELVGNEQHHEVALRGGLGDGQDLEPGLARLGDLVRALAQADDDACAGVPEVQRVRMAL